MKKRVVVTAFIEHADKVLLVRRSPAAPTYPGKWSAISGFLDLEEAPLEAANREAREEIGLERSSLTLQAPGMKIPAYDDELKVLWIVHPFRFTTSSSSVRLSHENTEFTWAAEEDFLKLKTVPKLLDAYHRTLPTPDGTSFDPEVAVIAERIRGDREHGATWLASESLTAMKVASVKTEAQSPAEFALRLTRMGRMLMSCRPTLASIGNILGQFIYALQERSKELDLESLRTWAASHAIELQNRSRDALRKIGADGAANVEPNAKILTHSYSATVKETLLRCAQEGRKFEVHVTESMPLGEGNKLAAELKEVGIKVVVIPDSAAAEFAKSCNMVLVGADSILADGSLINKVGTLTLGLAAKRFGIPLYSLAETTKFALNSLTGHAAKTETLVDQTELEVPLFDLTPGEYVEHYVTEVGQLSPNDIESRMCHQLQRTYL